MEGDERGAAASAAAAAVEEPAVGLEAEQLTDAGREAWLKEPQPFPKDAPGKAEGGEEEAAAPAAGDREEGGEGAEEEEAGGEGAEGNGEEAAPGERPRSGKRPASGLEARLREEIAKRRTAEQKAADLERKLSPPERREAPAAGKPEQRPAKPKPEEYKTVAEWVEAVSQWSADEAVFKDRQTRTQEAARTQREQAARALNEAQDKKYAQARKSHKDFDAVALNPDLNVPEGSTLDWWVMNSEHGAEVLYHYGSHPDELEALHAMPQIAQAKELARVEAIYSKSGEEEEDEGEEAEQERAAGGRRRPQVPRAPRPPSEAAARGAVDPRAAAIANGDFEAYNRLETENERKRGR